MTGPRVGLVGGGPWATMVHAPMLAASDAVELAGVWARRPEAAAELAGAHGVTAFASFEALLDAVDAVAFAVPPAVQADLGVVAASAGKALLLEKPIAADLDGAQRLADACHEAGVGTQVLLTWRYASAVRSFLADVAGDDWLGGRGVFLGGAQLGGPFATPWRLERGPLLDLGPHVVDLLDAALGPVVEVRASGDLLGWVGLLLTHESGAVSDVALCALMEPAAGRTTVEVHSRARSAAVDVATALDGDVFATVAAELARTAAGEPHPLDVGRGLHLQRVLADAEAQLRD